MGTGFRNKHKLGLPNYRGWKTLSSLYMRKGYPALEALHAVPRTYISTNTGFRDAINSIYMEDDADDVEDASLSMEVGVADRVLRWKQ